MRLICLHIAFVFAAFLSIGQTLNTHLSKPEINIGERVTITFSIQSDKPFDSIRYLPQSGVFEARNSASGDTNSISTRYELEIMKSFFDTTYQEGGKVIWKGKYEVTAWDSAYVVIPREQVVINDSVMYFPAALLEVGTPKADPSKPIRDINEEFTEVGSEEGFIAFLQKHWPWIAGVLLLIIVLVVLRLRGKKKIEKELPLRIKTLKEIDKLEKSKSYEQNLKEYYFDLSIILRKFFSNHFGERMMDKTTVEIEELLAKKGLEGSTIAVIRKILTQSDMVKFAKSEPPVSEVFVITNDARRVVNEVASLELTDE